jgi:hypothetical protein
VIKRNNSTLIIGSFARQSFKERGTKVQIGCGIWDWKKYRIIIRKMDIKPKESAARMRTDGGENSTVCLSTESFSIFTGGRATKEPPPAQHVVITHVAHFL